MNEIYLCAIIDEEKTDEDCTKDPNIQQEPGYWDREENYIFFVFKKYKKYYLLIYQKENNCWHKNEDITEIDKFEDIEQFQLVEEYKSLKELFMKIPELLLI